MNIKTYQELQGYLKEFINSHGGPAPYDFAGAFLLLDAILNNVSQYHMDSDIESLKETGYRLDDKQRQLLEKLLRELGSK